VLNMCPWELNNSPQISAAAETDGRPITRYATKTHSNGTAGREFGEFSSREFGEFSSGEFYGLECSCPVEPYGFDS